MARSVNINDVQAGQYYCGKQIQAVERFRTTHILHFADDSKKAFDGDSTVILVEDDGQQPLVIEAIVKK